MDSQIESMSTPRHLKADMDLAHGGLRAPDPGHLPARVQVRLEQVVVVRGERAVRPLGGLDARIDPRPGSRGDVVEQTLLLRRHHHHASQRGRRVEDDWLQRFETAYLDEARDWVRSVRERSARGPSAWDGYASMVVCDACVASAKSGRPVRVELPPAPGIYV